METYKIQLNYSVRENAKHEVLDSSLLANIRASDVSEAVRLYNSLKSQLPHLGSLGEQPTFQTPAIQEEKEEGLVGIRDCDRCGGEMVLRTARKGVFANSQFWGCNNYPRCRNTERTKE